MLLSLHNTEFLVQKTLILLSYFLAIPLLGYFRSWTAARLGDDTGQQLGFSTLNPMTHISFIWIFAILIFQDLPLGFGQYIPINAQLLEGKWQRLKMVCAYFSDAFLGMVLALVSLILCVLIFKQNPYTLYLNFQFFQLATQYTTSEIPSTFSLVMGLFLVRFALFNAMLSAFSFIINCFYMFFLSNFFARPVFPSYRDYFLVLVSFLALLFFQSFLTNLIVRGVLAITSVISYALGIIS